MNDKNNKDESANRESANKNQDSAPQSKSENSDFSTSSATSANSSNSGTTAGPRNKVRKDGLEDISDLIVERANNSHPTLKAVLSGVVEVFVKDRPFRAVFDFASSPTKRLAAGTKESDCIIECDERTLVRIHQGELNPQLAMVSDKILIKGKASQAVYFFNLLGD